MAKYKKGDYLRVLPNAKADAKLIGKTVQVYQVHGEDYLIMIDPWNPHSHCKAWNGKNCDNGTELDKAAMVLYNVQNINR